MFDFLFKKSEDKKVDKDVRLISVSLIQKSGEHDVTAYGLGEDGLLYKYVSGKWVLADL